MDGDVPSTDGEGSYTGHSVDNRPLLAGIHVREEDIEPQKGLDIASAVFRVAGVVILILALGQFAAWWINRPPGGAGLGLLIGDTIRLVVFAGLLWAAGDLASLAIKTHYDIRAARILLARQTAMIRQTVPGGADIGVGAPGSHRREGDHVEGETHGSGV
ncbi:MAG: hypothetical protein KY464_03685 [Gemmatimonadetes bacterium]|nr:hypothetical protein [Gemmatimonadota bacterium]